MENTNQISPVKTVRSNLKIWATIILACFFLAFLGLYAYTSAKDRSITELINAMNINSARWTELEKQQETLHEENNKLMELCDKQSKDLWGETAECPVKKNS